MHSFSLSHSTFQHVYHSFSHSPTLLILFIIFQTNSHFCLFLQANYYTYCLLPQFFSSYCNPGCVGVGFFFQSCEGVNCLVVPPVCLFKLLEPLIIFFYRKLLPRLSFLSGPRLFFSGQSYLENFFISDHRLQSLYWKVCIRTWQTHKLLIWIRKKVPWTYFGHQNRFQVVQIITVYSSFFLISQETLVSSAAVFSNFGHHLVL